MKEVMKKTWVNSIVLIFLISTLYSCSDTNDDLNSIEDKIEQDIVSGTWIITKFIDSGNDETSDYNNYNFSFNSDSSLIANTSNNSYTGTWNISDSNSNDDSVDDLDFNIHFSTPDDLEELSEDWSILTNSAKKIELIHVSGGNGGTDLLTFEKN